MEQESVRCFGARRQTEELRISDWRILRQTNNIPFLKNHLNKHTSTTPKRTRHTRARIKIIKRWFIEPVGLPVHQQMTRVRLDAIGYSNIIRSRSDSTMAIPLPISGPRSKNMKGVEGGARGH